MTEPSKSAKSTEKADGNPERARRRRVVPSVRRPRVAAVDKLADAAESGAKNAVSGAREARTNAARSGRTSTAKVAGDAGRAAESVAERPRSASGQAAARVRRA